jgi:hypothetical protein
MLGWCSLINARGVLVNILRFLSQQRRLWCLVLYCNTALCSDEQTLITLLEYRWLRLLPLPGCNSPQSEAAPHQHQLLQYHHHQQQQQQHVRASCCDASPPNCTSAVTCMVKHSSTSSATHN